MRADRAERRCSQFETLTDGRDLRDVTGGDDRSGERGKSVEQLQELLVVQAVVGGEGRAVGAILDVFPQVVARAVSLPSGPTSSRSMSLADTRSHSASS